MPSYLMDHFQLHRADEKRNNTIDSAVLDVGLRLTFYTFGLIHLMLSLAVATFVLDRMCTAR